jgi:hydrogenase 3 maturation protease
MRIAVVGVGQELLGDDAAGLEVCRRLEQRLANGEPTPVRPSPNRRLERSASPLLAGHTPEDRSGPPLAGRQPRTHPGTLILPAGPAPENCTGRLRRFAPDWVVLVDAARMDAAPGTVRWIRPEAAEGLGGSTHSLPLSLLSQYLADSLGCRVDLLGIQPAGSGLGGPLSAAVAAGVEAAAQQLSDLICRPWPERSPTHGLRPNAQNLTAVAQEVTP